MCVCMYVNKALSTEHAAVYVYDESYSRMKYIC